MTSITDPEIGEVDRVVPTQCRVCNILSHLTTSRNEDHSIAVIPMTPHHLAAQSRLVPGMRAGYSYQMYPGVLPWGYVRESGICSGRGAAR